MRLNICHAPKDQTGVRPHQGRTTRQLQAKVTRGPGPYKATPASRGLSGKSSSPSALVFSRKALHATVLKRRGANIAYISESLGHTSLATTQFYLDSFDKDERIRNAKLLKIPKIKNG